MLFETRILAILTLDDDSIACTIAHSLFPLDLTNKILQSFDALFPKLPASSLIEGDFYFHLP